MGLFLKRGKNEKSDNADTPEERQASLSTSESERLGQAAFENNPWADTRRRHFNIYEHLASSLSQWRVATLMMMVFLMISVAGNVYLSQSVRVQPYIIQVDRHGYAIPVKMVDVANVDQRVIASQVGLFIFNSRTRVMDRQAQVIFASNAYRSVAAGSSASKQLDAYFRAAPPTQAAFPVVVEVHAIVPFTAHTYEAEWTEIAAGGSAQATYVGLFTIAISPPTDFENLLTNPMGVYITDYSLRQETTMQ
jgi:type IV secretion system protein VirB5